ncbi:phosphorylase family protein [Sorangium sp. So ce117]|uniref:5'-methylthioadenosine/S-adenosylhomocysteine nucleosidase family protein n=1 Tax=Sorangium sp. So ce117 TaxID=3133277 RepID=UPI003F624687
MPAPTDTPIDFAILTAIEVERKAVCTAFSLTEKDRVKKDGRVYWRGKLPLPDGDAYEVVVAQPADMGNIEAALLASDVIKHWQPSAALLVGIAASTDKDVKLGDVVVGRTVYYYEHGKVTPDGTKPQPEMINADSVLLNHVVALPDWEGKLPAARPDGRADAPQVHRGVIASGEKVIASAATRDEIANSHRKIIALEMEGYGFSRAVWQSFERVRHLDIRGICDDGSETKDDRWHKYAAAAAASFARHFLSDRPVEPRSKAANRP